MKRRLLLLPVLASLVDPASPADKEDPARALRRLAGDYYRWRNQEFPVASSEQGLHTGDDRLTDYTEEALRARRDKVQKLITQVRALAAEGWVRDDRIDRALFLAQLEREDFFDRERARPETDPQTYVSECSNAIFSLLKKNYDAPRNRALSATARLKAMPALLEQGQRTLTRPVRLYARLAIESARAMDGLFVDSLMTLAGDLSPVEGAELVAARDRALGALKAFSRWLEDRLPGMAEFVPMGAER